MLPVVWLCADCDQPVSFTVEVTRTAGGLVVHADQPIRIHLKQHERG